MQRLVVTPISEEGLEQLVTDQNDEGFKLSFLEVSNSLAYLLFDNGKPIKAKRKK